MSDFDLKKTLEDLHRTFILELKKRVDSGTATSGDMALAWKILEDNGVPLADLRNKANPQDEAAEDAEFLGSLPFPSKIA